MVQEDFFEEVIFELRSELVNKGEGVVQASGTVYRQDPESNSLFF